MQAAVDGVVRYFVPLVLFLAFVSFAFWNTTGAPIAREAGMDAQSMALLNLLSVLIIACPCALGLATALATLVAACGLPSMASS